MKETLKKKICGAKTRKNTPCRNHPVKGRSRCRVHGGKTPVGSDSPHHKHGLYSKYAGKKLQAVLEQLQDVDSEQLIKPVHEIRLLQALLLSADALKNGAGSLEELEGLTKVIARLILVKQRSQAIMLEQERLIPASDFERFFSWMGNMLIDEVGQEKAYTVINKMKSFKIDSHEAG